MISLFKETLSNLCKVKETKKRIENTYPEKYLQKNSQVLTLPYEVCCATEKKKKTFYSLFKQFFHLKEACKNVDTKT